MKAVLLARVSTKEQTEGYSLDAQVDRIEQYISDNDQLILGDDARFIFDETARKTNRKKFDDVLKYLKQNTKQETVAVCADKVDRLIRNFAQRIHTIYDFVEAGQIELHFVSDNMVITKDSSATEKFMLNIAVSLAQYYSDASSDNIKRGYERMVAEGRWFGNAAFGYMNVTDPVTGRRKDIVPHPEQSKYVRELYKRYATGEHSLHSLAEWLRREGVKTNRGYYLRAQSVQKILKNPFYYGEISSPKYGTFKHVYEPLITRELFESVAQLRRKRNKQPTQSMTKRKYIFQGLLTCMECGCSYTPEIKKGRYVYYSCTNAKKNCRRLYVSERKLLSTIEQELKKLPVSEKTAEVIVDYLEQEYLSENRHSQDRYAKLKTELERLQDKIDFAADKLFDGKVSQEVYDRKVSEYQNRKTEIQEQIQSLSGPQTFNRLTIHGVFEIGRSALELFKCSEIREKRQIAKTLFQNFFISGKTPYFSMHNVWSEMAKTPDYLDWCPQWDRFRTIDWKKIDEVILSYKQVEANHQVPKVPDLPEYSDGE